MPVTAKREEVKRGSANDMRIMEAITDATDGLTADQIMAKLKISKKAAYGRLAFLVEQDVIKVTDAAKRGGAKTFTMKPSMLAP